MREDIALQIHMTHNQALCDECGNFQRRRLHARTDFEEVKRLCTPCAIKHDKHPEVQKERDHLSAIVAETDDF